MRRILWPFLAILCLTCWAKSEVVTFKNGDRLSGHWKRVQGKDLKFKSEVLGDVTIAVDKLASFSVPKEVAVITERGETFHGVLSLLPSGDWKVEESGTAKTLPAKSVAAIIPDETYRSSVSDRPALPWKGWKSQTNLGFSVQQGFEQSRTLSVGISAIRRQPALAGLAERWRTNFALNVNLATTESAGVRISAHTLSGSLRQDYLLGPRAFLFVLGQIDQIQPQNLNLRQTYGGGIGRDLLAKSRVGLSLLAGTTYVNEKFVATPSSNNAEALTGEKFGADLLRGVRLEHYLNFFTNLSHTGQYRFDSATSLSLKLNSWLGLHASVADFYTSTASPTRQITTISPNGTVVTRTVGAQKNNVILTTGLSFNF